VCTDNGRTIVLHKILNYIASLSSPNKIYCLFHLHFRRLVNEIAGNNLISQSVSKSILPFMCHQSCTVHFLNFFNGFFCLGSIMMQYNLKSYATQLFFRYLCTPVKEHALIEVHDGLNVFGVINKRMH
jgi:hypothetical protein